MSDIDACYRCDKDALTPGKGTIHVRRQIAGRWMSVPICETCWDIEQPGRKPVRVVEGAE
jgi:hypothetical protein